MGIQGVETVISPHRLQEKDEDHSGSFGLYVHTNHTDHEYFHLHVSQRGLCVLSMRTAPSSIEYVGINEYNKLPVYRGALRFL